MDPVTLTLAGGGLAAMWGWFTTRLSSCEKARLGLVARVARLEALAGIETPEVVA